MEYGIDHITKMLLYQDILSVITRVLSFLVSLANVTVILVMFVKCGKFRRTRAYNDYNGIKGLSKALEVIVIFLAIEAVYGLTRIFSIIDAVNLIKSIIPEFPDSVTAYLIFVTVALPIINCVISVLAWSYYQGTRRLFFSVYPNGVQKIDFIGRQSTAMPDESLFGSSSEANLNYGPQNAAAGAALVSDFSDRSDKTAWSGAVNQGSQSFYAKASAVNSISTANTNNANAQNKNRTQNQNGFAVNNNVPYPHSRQNYGGSSQPAAENNDDLFGAGVSDNYINRLTAADEAKLEQLLVQDTPETVYKVTPAVNGSSEGDIFGTGSELWEAVPDMNDPMLKEILIADEPEASSEVPVYKNGQEAFFGTGTTEDYMKRFTSADEDIISELLVQDEPK